MRDETITLNKYRKEALTSRDLGDTVEGQYHIISDEVEEDGTRVIRLKPQDLTEIKQKAKEVVDAIADRLGEGRSKHFKAILFDALADYRPKDILRIHEKLALGKEPVKAKPFCFEIIIGDGRKKNSEIIRIR